MRMNEWHVTTIRNSAKNKEGKQDTVNLEAFIFDSTYYQSLELSSCVMWWRMNVDDVTWRDMSKSTHGDDNNDNETTTKLQSTGNDLPN
jgi:hypothetical protein